MSFDPYLARVRTDMELAFVESIPTNFHSRTRLPGYSRLPGGETTATMRLHCDEKGFKGNVQYTPAWMDYTIRILNQGDQSRERYLFRADGGIQNSDQKGRMEQLTCEGNVVLVIGESGDKCFLRTFSLNETPPMMRDVHDPRVQRITVVNRLDQLTRSTKDDVYFPLMARAGERLWLDRRYLEPLKTVYAQFTLSVTNKEKL